MDFLTVFAAVILLPLIAYLSWHYLTYGFGPYKGGLRIDPFLGVIPSLSSHGDDLFDFLTDILEKTPKMSFFAKVPGDKWLLTANPVHIQHILKDNFANYPKGHQVRETSGDLLGHGIFTTDGEAWKQQRKFASYEFSTNSLRNLMLVSIKEETETRLIPTLEHAVKNNKSIDLHDTMLRFTFDNICRIGFGVDTKALSPDFPPVPFATSIDKATILSSLRGGMPSFVWKFMRFWNLGSERQFAQEMKVVNTFVKEVVEKRRQELEARGRVKEHSEDVQDYSLDRADLLSRMMLLGEKDHGQTFSDSFLRDSCLNFLIAGRDTTAVTLSWFFWLLTRHPEVEQKIVAELQSIIDRRADDKDAPFSFDELKLMTYTHAALNETLRLHTTVPIDVKAAAKDDVLPDGTLVRKGWRVFYVIYAVGRMTRVWGPDAMEFKPERWITEDGQLRNESPFKFIAFNAGPRLCLGKDMAYLTMKSVASSVLRKFTFQLVPGHQVKYAISLTLLMKDGLQVTVHPR